jgi:hypothetical protein
VDYVYLIEMILKPTISRIISFATTAILGMFVVQFIWSVFLKFGEEGRGSMSFCEGSGLGGFAAYKSYDGEKLIIASISFESTEEAHKCYQRIQKDLQILETETLYDKGAKTIVGERIVTTNLQTYAAEIISLDNDHIYEIGSTSLKHALIFESLSRKY